LKEDEQVNEDRSNLLLSREDQEILGELDEGSITPQVRRHAQRPSNWGRLLLPNGEATVTGICEDTVCIQIRLTNNAIEEIRFQTDGCGFTRACASVATELALGQKLDFALRFTGAQIVEALGYLPKGHRHCADLAANALRGAAADAVERRRSPWKHLYASR
jgi:NifU-like protein involved in Fe-S cluster formation